MNALNIEENNRIHLKLTSNIITKNKMNYNIIRYFNNIRLKLISHFCLHQNV